MKLYDVKLKHNETGKVFKNQRLCKLTNNSEIYDYHGGLLGLTLSLVDLSEEDVACVVMPEDEPKPGSVYGCWTILSIREIPVR